MKEQYYINNELERTDTNSGHSEFVRIRISSLLISALVAHPHSGRKGGMSVEDGRMTEIGKIPTNRYGTRMTRIARIFTDPRASASSAQSVFYRNPATIDYDKKPQINADERRYVHEAVFGEIIHHKGRKERKANLMTSLRHICSGMKEVIFSINKDPKGGFNACALEHSIFTQGETIEDARGNIIDTVSCHFDNPDDIIAEAILHERR